ncbi:MAG TPA: CHRD domain-containing protein [Chitinophagaceae bacterium]
MKLKTWLTAALLAIATTGMIVGCDKDDDDNDDDEIFSLSGNATGAKEIPAVTTNATGTLTGSLNTTARTLTYSVNWTGLSGNATAAHFHAPASTSQNAGPMITLTITNNAATGMASGTITNLHDTTIAHFKNGMVYYNIHTAANPNGEIRSQVVLD